MSSSVLFRVPYHLVVTLTSTVPALALLTCAAVGMGLHWNKLLHTHCYVYNFLPSISAMIGHYLPERYIWRLAMSIVCFPKFLDGYLYYRLFINSCYSTHTRGSELVLCWLNRLTCALHYCQWLLLLTVSYISAKEHNGYHIGSFFLWLLISTLHMALFIVVYKKCTISKKSSAIKHRQWCLLIQVAAVVGFAYFAYRHNTFCEPYIYSYLAVCEYVIGATFTWFHAVGVSDFKHYYICINI